MVQGKDNSSPTPHVPARIRPLLLKIKKAFKMSTHLWIVSLNQVFSIMCNMVYMRNSCIVWIVILILLVYIHYGIYVVLIAAYTRSRNVALATLSAIKHIRFFFSSFFLPIGKLSTIAHYSNVVHGRQLEFERFHNWIAVRICYGINGQSNWMTTVVSTIVSWSPPLGWWWQRKLRHKYSWL